MLGIFDYTKEKGFKAVLVDTETNTPLVKLRKVTEGWARATAIKKTNPKYKGIGTVRCSEEFEGEVTDQVSAGGNTATITVPSKYTISQRFTFMNDLIKMVLNRSASACIVCGPGGIGKTYSVLENLVRDEQREGLDYVIFKGHMSPMALFMALYDNRDKTVVFDDCDSVLKNEISENLLKAALDTYEKRILSWNSRAMQALSDEYEETFEFTGRVIFISNLSQDRINQALVSRSMVLDLNMTRADICEHIVNLAPRMVGDDKVRKDCLNFIDKNKETIRDLNLRTLLKVAKIRRAADNPGTKVKDWQGMAAFLCCG
jgi:hypothetical protein